MNTREALNMAIAALTEKRAGSSAERDKEAVDRLIEVMEQKAPSYVQTKEDLETGMLVEVIDLWIDG